jgi:hypothetical protein
MKLTQEIYQEPKILLACVKPGLKKQQARGANPMLERLRDSED